MGGGPVIRSIHKHVHGVALVAVLVVVAIGALVGSTLLYGAEAGRGVGAASVRVQQSRMSAWSGVQAVMAELAEQRDELLRGGEPRVMRAMRLGAAEGGGVAVYRVVGAEGREVVSEGAKLDVNIATAAMLAKAPGLDEQRAARIVAARGERGFESVLELGRVEGVTLEPVGGTEGEGVGLADVLTVFSFDLDVQAGVGPRAGAARGQRRIAVNGEWSEELERRVGAWMERTHAEVVAGLVRKEKQFGSLRDVVNELIVANVPPAAWGAVLDVVTVSEAEFVRGRVDVNRAPAEVLACVPGIDEEAAERIVEARRSLSSDERGTTAWVVTEGVLTPRQFAEAVDHLTSRSMQWRVVVEGGRLLEPERERRAIEIGGVTGDDVGDVPEDAQLLDRVVLEAVIDVAGDRPRVAYLRDVTMLPVAEVLARRAAREAERSARLAESGPAREDDEPSPFVMARKGDEPNAERGRAGAAAAQRGRSATGSRGGEEASRSGTGGGRIGRWTVGAGGGR